MRRAARQELPRGAFVTVDQLRSATRIQDEGLRILVLSYGWMTRSHPDPLGENLQRLAGVFALFSRTLGIHGVFWDFASLMQHSPLPGGPRRTEEEQRAWLQEHKAHADADRAMREQFAERAARERARPRARRARASPEF